MWNKAGLIFAAGLIVTACAVNFEWHTHKERKTVIEAERSIPEDFIPRTFKLAAIGDSLTQGVGDSTDSGGYLPYLNEMLEQEKGVKEASFINLGVRGTRSDQLLRKLETDKMQEAIAESDIVIVTIGGNDVMKVARENILNLQYDAFEEEMVSYTERVNEIFKKIRSENPEAAIVLVGIYNPFGKWFTEVDELNQIVDDWNEAGKSVVSQYPDSYFVGIDDLFVTTDVNLLFDDQFHPNDKGYQLIAERVYETLGEEALPVLARKDGTAADEENSE
ncbi:SGNH/GDSL hydrolase family protein [Bacillus sp. FJAT-27225]|uniref:SGNH/GDSL hydrolase family protein n=1 Tax=Bacillus sp. FJAT-27225 TaxID=1743144 RepID=UPI000B2454DD|nr:SGNH/GDSL hydrolase family protein [Bacillus sp. FJAT-27225]